MHPNMGGLGGRGTPDPRVSLLWPPAWCWLLCPETLPSAAALAGWGLGVTFALHFVRCIQISYNRNVLPFRLKYTCTYTAGLNVSNNPPETAAEPSFENLQTAGCTAGRGRLSFSPLHFSVSTCKCRLCGPGSRRVPRPRRDFWKGPGIAP